MSTLLKKSSLCRIIENPSEKIMFLLILKMKRIRFGTSSISKDKECAGLEFRLEDVCVFVSPWVHGYELVAECCKGECGFVLQWRSGQCTTLCVFAMIECTPHKCIYDLLSPSVCVFSAARVSVCVWRMCAFLWVRVWANGGGNLTTCDSWWADANGEGWSREGNDCCHGNAELEWLMVG